MIRPGDNRKSSASLSRPTLLFRMLLCLSAQLFNVSDAVLHPIMLLRAFGVVEAIQGSNQVTGNPANPLEGLIAKVIGQIHIIAVHMNVDAKGLAAKLGLGAGDIGVNLRLGKLSAGNRNAACHKYHLLVV